MLMSLPCGLEYLTSNVTTEPASNAGTLVTASVTTHTKGGWTELLDGTAVTSDVYFIVVRCSAFAAANAARVSLVDIGIDTANGSSYTVLIPNLLSGNAGAVTSSIFGCFFAFPLFIPAGTSIAARCQSGTSSGTGRVTVWLYGKPSNPAGLKFGTRVIAYGPDESTSLGASVTPGTATYSGYVDLGNVGTDGVWWWQTGFAINNATQAANDGNVSLALGDASNKRVINRTDMWVTNTSEAVSKLTTGGNYIAKATSADNIYASVSAKVAPVTGCQVAAYGML